MSVEAAGGNPPRHVPDLVGALSDRAIIALFVLLSAAMIAPMALASYPPLVDYPNHMARLHILARGADVPELARAYAANWMVLPNLAIDLMLVPLVRLFPVDVVGRVFVVVIMAMLAGGVFVLNRALHGRWSLWPAAILLALYNYPLSWGFLNYLFGVGLILFVFAAWVATAERWRLPLRLAVFSAVPTALFFVHGFALVVYGLTLGCHELYRIIRASAADRRRMLAATAAIGATFLPAAALVLTAPVGDTSQLTEYGQLWDKIATIFSPSLFLPHPIDFFTWSFLVFMLIAARWIGLWQMRPDMTWPILALGALTIVMPNWLLGVWGADFRMPFIIAALIIASSRLTQRPDRRIFGRLLIGVGVVLLVARAVEMYRFIADFDRQVAELREVYREHLPAGARLLVGQSDQKVDPPPIKFRWFYWHLASYAVIDRSAFVPFVFTDPSKQPLTTTPAYAMIDAPYGQPLLPEELANGADPTWAAVHEGRLDGIGTPYYYAYWPRNFDYLLYIRFNTTDTPVPDHLVSVRRGSYFELFKIVR